MYFLLWLSIEKKSKNVGVWQYMWKITAKINPKENSNSSIIENSGFIIFTSLRIGIVKIITALSTKESTNEITALL